MQLLQLILARQTAWVDKHLNEDFLVGAINAGVLGRRLDACSARRGVGALGVGTGRAAAVAAQGARDLCGLEEVGTHGVALRREHVCSAVDARLPARSDRSRRR